MTVATGQNAEAQDIIKSTAIYAADAGANDTYAVSLPTAPTAYADGLMVNFKANTANTGASTLNVNSLGAIAIKRPDGTDTQTGDIVANQIVQVVYRSSAFYMTSAPNINQQFNVGVQANTLNKTYINLQSLFVTWTGDTDGAATTLKDNWETNNTQITVNLHYAYFDGNSGSRYLVCSDAIPGSSTAAKKFSDSGLIIMEWDALLPSGGGGNSDINMGFGSEPASFTGVYNDSSGNGDAVKFALVDSGTLYAVVAEETTGASTSDITSSVTLGQINNFRIELDLGVEARFYVNGELLATLSGGNLPNTTNQIDIGFGRDAGTDLFMVTPPRLSVEMRP